MNLIVAVISVQLYRMGIWRSGALAAVCMQPVCTNGLDFCRQWFSPKTQIWRINDEQNLKPKVYSSFEAKTKHMYTAEGII